MRARDFAPSSSAPSIREQKIGARLFVQLPTYLTFITYIRTWRLLSGWSAVKPLVSSLTLGTWVPVLRYITILSSYRVIFAGDEEERKKESHAIAIGTLLPYARYHPPRLTSHVSLIYGE